jgi:8-oxo-dGTP pyrophosphatase MutT (NUDIX family)
VRKALAEREPRRIPDGAADRRAAVTLVLSDRVAESVDSEEPAALFVRRARMEGDPWSGHMALPGGREDPEDPDLLETARREACEETGLWLARGDFLGRLDDIHPRSRHLPSIAVTPFVAWHRGEPRLVLNQELDGYVWIPVSSLDDPELRSTLHLAEPVVREFPAIAHEGDVIWGLTLAIVENFLDALRAVRF